MSVVRISDLTYPIEWPSLWVLVVRQVHLKSGPRQMESQEEELHQYFSLCSCVAWQKYLILRRRLPVVGRKHGRLEQVC